MRRGGRARVVRRYMTDDGEFYPFAAFDGYLCRFDADNKVCYETALASAAARKSLRTG